MTDTAKPQPPAHRAAPRLVPSWVLMLAGLVGSAGLISPAPANKVMAATALIICLTWFIQRWRYAGWVVPTGAAQELESR